MARFLHEAGSHVRRYIGGWGEDTRSTREEADREEAAALALRIVEQARLVEMSCAAERRYEAEKKNLLAALAARREELRKLPRKKKRPRFTRAPGAEPAATRVATPAA